MTRFHSIVAGALVAGLLAAGTASAQGPRGGGSGPVRQMAQVGRGMVRGLPIGALNLTPTQQDLIQDIRRRARDEARQWQEKLREAQAAQRAAVHAIPLNEGQIRAATLARAELEAELAIHEARVRNEIFATLSAEQQAQVTKTLAEREQRMQQRRAEMEQRAAQRRQNRQ